jgi:hypothetical protein
MEARQGRDAAGGSMLKHDSPAGARRRDAQMQFDMTRSGPEQRAGFLVVGHFDSERQVTANGGPYCLARFIRQR